MEHPKKQKKFTPNPEQWNPVAQAHEANNLQELEQVYRQILVEPDDKLINQVAMRTVAQKVLQQAFKLQEHNSHMQKQIQELQPVNLAPQDEQTIAHEMATTPLQGLRQALLSKPMAPANLAVYRLVILGLLSRCEALDQETQALKNELDGLQPSKTSSAGSDVSPVNALRRAVLVLETERHALVQVIRIMASQGKLDPVEESSQPL